MSDLPEEAVQAALAYARSQTLLWQYVDERDIHGLLTAAAPVLAAHARQDDALLAEVDRLREQVAELQEDAAFLNALQTAGVDNWDGYSYACEIARGEADG